MFTGIIEEIGKVKKVENLNSAKRITITAKVVLENTKIDDSISIQGACQTVIDINSTDFSVIAVEETLRKTNLKSLKVGDLVNLERALTLNTRLGGHLVQGHIDCVGKVSAIEKNGVAQLLTVEFPSEYEKYTIKKGSIAINGVSLTIAELKQNFLTVSLIPHTLNKTTLQYLKVGSEVNLEFDLIAKYIEKIIKKEPELIKNYNQPQNSILTTLIDQPNI